MPTATVPEPMALGAVEVDRIFEALSSAGGGGTVPDVTFEQFCAAVTGDFSESMLRFVFQEADEDGDGRLSLEEVRRVLGRLRLLQGEEPVAASGGLSLAAMRLGATRLTRQCRLAFGLLREQPLEELPAGQRALVRQAAVEVGKAVPCLGIAAVVPGGSLILPALVMYWPGMAPSAFRSVLPSRSAPTRQRPDKFQELQAHVFRSLLDYGLAAISECPSAESAAEEVLMPTAW